MRIRSVSYLGCLAAVLTAAHPMGNFSVSHYSRLEPTAKGLDLTYVLDLAEIPTYTLLRDWKLDAKASQEDLNKQASDQARIWEAGLVISSLGRPLTPDFVSAAVRLTDGAGGLSVTRIEMHFRIPDAKGSLDYEDQNFPDRAGWKEIVVKPGAGAQIVKTSQSEQDMSKALTEYPPDPTSAPPQDLRASIEWNGSPAPVATPQVPVAPRIVPVPQPKPVDAPNAAPPPSSTPGTRQPPGTVVKGDYLSKLLGQKEIGLWFVLVGMVVALGLGGAHAMTPGHGKTIVAAYLVGSRGTSKHAVFLGAMVTLTHTLSVFLLGLATLFLTKYVNQEKISQILGVVSGLSIIGIGTALLWQRWKKFRASKPQTQVQHLAHDHNHDGDPDHDHHHGPGGHTHVPQGEITLGGLVALGVSGGLVPCPSALVILLSAIALGHAGLGLILLVAFSLGLAGVLMAIGMAVLYAKSWLPDPRGASKHTFFRLVPVLSAGVVVCLGLLMTGVSLGWISPSLAG